MRIKSEGGFDTHPLFGVGRLHCTAIFSQKRQKTTTSAARKSQRCLFTSNLRSHLGFGLHQWREDTADILQELDEEIGFTILFADTATFGKRRMEILLNTSDRFGTVQTRAAFKV